MQSILAAFNECVVYCVSAAFSFDAVRPVCIWSSSRPPACLLQYPRRSPAVHDLCSLVVGIQEFRPMVFALLRAADQAEDRGKARYMSLAHLYSRYPFACWIRPARVFMQMN
jgi:hypothetical protein